MIVGAGNSTNFRILEFIRTYSSIIGLLYDTLPWMTRYSNRKACNFFFSSFSRNNTFLCITAKCQRAKNTKYFIFIIMYCNNPAVESKKNFRGKILFYTEVYLATKDWKYVVNCYWRISIWECSVYHPVTIWVETQLQATNLL